MTSLWPGLSIYIWNQPHLTGYTTRGWTFSLMVHYHSKTSSLRRNHRFRFVIPEHIQLSALETPLSSVAVLALLMAKVGNSSSAICKLDFITHLKACSFHSFVFLSVSNIILMSSIFQCLVCVRTNSFIRRRVTSWSTYLYLWPIMSGDFKVGLPEKYI